MHHSVPALGPDNTEWGAPVRLQTAFRWPSFCIANFCLHRRLKESRSTFQPISRVRLRQTSPYWQLSYIIDRPCFASRWNPGKRHNKEPAGFSRMTGTPDCRHALMNRQVHRARRFPKRTRSWSQSDKPGRPKTCSLVRNAPGILPPCPRRA